MFGCVGDGRGLIEEDQALILDNIDNFDLILVDFWLDLAPNWPFLRMKSAISYPGHHKIFDWPYLQKYLGLGK